MTGFGLSLPSDNPGHTLLVNANPDGGLVFAVVYENGNVEEFTVGPEHRARFQELMGAL